MGLQVDGSQDAPLLVVMDAPSRPDAEGGLPLSCQDAQRFWRLAAQAGITRSMTRVVCCVGEPADKHVGRGRYVVSERQVLRDRPLFIEALESSQARVALCLGGDAFKLATGLTGGVDQWGGYTEAPTSLPTVIMVKTTDTRYRKADKRCKCVTVVREESVGKRGGRKLVTVRTVDAECKVCGGSGFTARKGDVILFKKAQQVRPPLSALTNLQRFMCTFDPGVMRMMGFALMPVWASHLKRAGRALRGELKLGTVHFDESPTIFVAGGMVAVDIETQRHNSYHLERVGVANDTQTWTLPWHSSAQVATRANLVNASTVIIHNVGFDEPRLRAAGAPVPSEVPIFCTMLGTYMVLPDGKKGLNYAISVFLDAERHKHLSDEQPALYNALDTRRTYDLHAPICKELERTGQRTWFEQSVMPAARTLIRMSERGVRVDAEALSKWRSALVAKQVELEEWWKAESGGLNAGSWQQVSKFFGTLRSDEDTLLAHYRVSGDERVKRFLELRRVSDDISDYTEIALSEDGCVHPSFLPGQKDDDTVVGKGISYSGRWTAREPNMQKIPKPPSLARTIYVPHAPGRVLVSRDWSQCELRVTAALSGDEVLAADLELENFFGALSSRLGCSKQVAKTGVYLSAYLGAPKTLHKKFQAEGVAISYGECVAFQRSLFDRYRGWADYRQRVIREVEAKRELRIEFGKWAPFPGGRNDASKAVNFPPQATNAAMATRILPQLEAALRALDAYLLLVVHDEFVVDAPVERVREVSEMMREVMEQPFHEVRQNFKVPTNVKVGLNWGEMKEMEEFMVEGVNV